MVLHVVVYEAKRLIFSGVAFPKLETDNACGFDDTNSPFALIGTPSKGKVADTRVRCSNCIKPFCYKPSSLLWQYYVQRQELSCV